jgi:MYXO-CTERM domain-containing protein
MVRAGLMPAVAMSTVAVNTSAVEKVAIVGLLMLLVALAIWATRRRHNQCPLDKEEEVIEARTT